MRFSFLRAAALALASLAFIPAAQATILVSLGSVTPAVGGFRFNYNVSFDWVDASPALTITLESGDFFTIYDFAGLVPATNLQPVDWVFSSAPTGVDPSGTTPPDDPAVPNLTWTYSGASRITDGSLGAFSAVSLHGDTAIDIFAAQNTQTFVGFGTFPVSNASRVDVPFPAAVPEPATFALLGLGLLGIGFSQRRKS